MSLGLILDSESLYEYRLGPFPIRSPKENAARYVYSISVFETMAKAFLFDRSRLCLMLLLLAVNFVSGAAAKGKADDANSFPYLYATRTNVNASFPVIEHFAPTGKKHLENNKPNFLYKGDQGYRIVNFYGHWCNTCKNFKPHFVSFAQRVIQLAAQQNQTVKIYGVSCHPNRRLCRAVAASGFPIIRLLRPGATITGIDLKHTEINPVKALQKMGMELDLKDIDDSWDTTFQDNQVSQWQRMMETIFGKSANSIQYHRRTRDELKADIHLSFDFAMRDGVFSSDAALTEKASKALKDWLKLLHKTLPESWEIHNLLETLIRDFNYVSRHESYLYSILDQFPPDSSVWSPACSHGDPDAGYTCGLWELFHSMTVGLVDYNGLVHEKRRIATEDAAHTLRDYVENFFGCVECRNNFLTMYDSCAHDRCNRLVTDVTGLPEEKQRIWAQMPLWLFEAHNAVNVRLMKERAQRENREPTLQNEIDVLWPPKRDCSPCWKSDRETGKVSWNETNVYKWLLLEYGLRDVNSGKLREELLGLTTTEEAEKNRKQRQIGISTSSALMAFCFVFLLGTKMRKRRVTGRRKKDDDDAKTGLSLTESSMSNLMSKRNTLSKKERQL